MTDRNHIGVNRRGFNHGAPPLSVLAVPPIPSFTADSADMRSRMTAKPECMGLRMFPEAASQAKP
jgi:hypothetical protein